MENKGWEAFIDYLIDHVLFPEPKEGGQSDVRPREGNTHQPA